MNFSGHAAGGEGWEMGLERHMEELLPSLRLWMGTEHLPYSVFLSYFGDINTFQLLHYFLERLLKRFISLFICFVYQILLLKECL